MRSAVIALAGVSLASATLPAKAQSTTRIESRPFYGATVTVEEGVRVFRPLPPQGRFIIKADGTDALALGSSQPDNCACNRTYLHHVGETAGSSRYLRRIEETQPLSGPR
jgi:hypothetical protein